MAQNLNIWKVIRDPALGVVSFSLYVFWYIVLKQSNILFL